MTDDTISEFDRLVAGQGAVDLIAIWLELTRDAYPDLDAEHCRDELTSIARQAIDRIARLPDDRRRVKDRLQEVSRVVYGEEQFHGDVAEYYDPRNSYLPDVLERRLGIPITLGLVYMEVCRQAGLEVFGVPTPGHFVLGCVAEDQTLYIDPFNDGDVLPQSACRHRIERMTGQTGVLRDEHFRPASPHEIVVRVLRNLKGAYARDDRWREVLPVQKRLIALVPDDVDEMRDLGLVYLRLGTPRDAWAWLSRYREQCDEAAAAQIEPYLQAARRLLAELN